MFRHLNRLRKKITRLVQRVVTVLARRTDARLRQAWAAHGSRVKTDATYAAVVTVVLSGVFSAVPVRDVLSTLLAALLGVFGSSPSRTSHVGRCDDPGSRLIIPH